ncbi:RNA polymerase sigma factor [Pseudobacter ginsenosidimutans]|uniref:RNA polymerase sigma-70 factor (ECF subfamily) n=1 Tax=Pseudobacter ginsenosidimutans TaxID=661488 RepID=A0A4Q7N105_9BACT|nr:RNA polymerase sigma-70 factor [Pseudobacter ginsenosidimutans]QEC43465.1 RNA polymerase sigma-70 factor [Pseudobacter ginsenosidimutans]RZS74852.1 RNA polymerase sigma-70 factor (ECF subfamily) [Pseudobacter ginsenosidimutans]
MSNNPYYDKELFKRIAEEDASAYQTVFELYYDKLHFNALKFLKSEFWAEEIVQEVFLELWDDRKKLVEIESPAAWMYRMVSNKCFNLLRRQEREMRIQYYIQLSKKTANDCQQNGYDFNLIRRLVLEAISKLPDQQRRIFLLRQEDGLSYKEIAQHLGISPNTVHTHLARSIQSVRNYLLVHGNFNFWIFFIIFFECL